MRGDRHADIHMLQPDERPSRRMTDSDGGFRHVPADVHAEGDGRMRSVHGGTNDGHIRDLLGAHLQGGRTVPGVLHEKTVEAGRYQDVRLSYGIRHDVIQWLTGIVVRAW